MVKTPVSVHYYLRGMGQGLGDALTNNWLLLPYTIEPQGEAICWQGREEGFYTLSEGASQPIYYYASDDGDADGLRSSAEIAYGTDTNNADSDGDGQIDGDEVIAGTDPTNATSSFFVAVAGHTGTTLRLQWLARTNRQYDVQRSTGTPEQTYATIASNIAVTSDQVLTTNVTVSNVTEFYRLEVRDTSGW